MAVKNDKVYKALKHVTKNVFYLSNANYGDESNNMLPFIVWNITSKVPISGDNKVLLYKVTYHITLVTKSRSEGLAHRLESSLNEHGFPHRMISSYQNDDFSLNRVYEIQIITKGGY